MIEPDILIVGAGFAGLYMLHSARKLGLSARVIEAGQDVGGTWYWNRYPGARCDVESFSYSYSFSEELQQDWTWSHRYATQPEILSYARHVADRFDLRKDISFGMRVTSATWNEERLRWQVETDKGQSFAARFLVMATGCLSVPKVPDLPHLEDFRGQVLHTAKWPEQGVDFTGRKVGLVGTGSSAIQSIPIIAREAGHLTVFQRTANFSVPAWNAPVSPAQDRDVKQNYKALRAKGRATHAGDIADEGYVAILGLDEKAREAAFETCWAQGGFSFQYAYSDLMVSEEANRLAADFVRRKIRETVRDPKTAERLCPRDHPLGSKRLCVDTDYYETYNRPNVSLVDLRDEPIERFTPGGLKTSAGQHDFDTLVLATGFDAMTGALTAFDIRGANGMQLRDAWAGGPAAYLGIAVAGFPNFFVITGPGSPSVLASVLLAIEQHVEWLSGLLNHAQTNGIMRIEADRAAQAGWTKRVAKGAEKTLFTKGNSWYLGSNVPGKPRVFMPFADGFCVYEKICNDIAAEGYSGFHLARDLEIAR
ncbi:flavin-containing monooxygenase [Aestuariivirga sp.]|uniref:flavin-containing monooxygenase n=1 Tax=Aestuariivirga sp. TaxID=2650926 RepID=UPI0035935C49